MKVVVDVRENESVLHAFSQAGIVCTGEQLDVGDISIREDDDTVVWLAERKTLPDLRASLCDGRYKEQKTRLKQFAQDHPEAVVTYIIEGDTRTFVCGRGTLSTDKMRPAMMGALMSCITGGSGGLLRGAILTQDAIHTAGMVKQIARAMERWDKKKAAEEAGRKRKRDDDSVLHTRPSLSKRACKTPQDSATAILTCVEGVSVDKARTALAHFKSLGGVLAAPDKELADVKCGNRRLGDAMVSKLRAIQNAEFATSEPSTNLC